jgi:hypothetical protein
MSVNECGRRDLAIHRSGSKRLSAGAMHRKAARDPRSRAAFRGYYLWALAVKLPVPLFISSSRFVAGVVAGVSMSSVNMGVRHVLPVFGLLALLAGRGIPPNLVFAPADPPPVLDSDLDCGQGLPFELSVAGV